MGCFYENGLEFSCKRCSACCGKTPGVVYLSRQDLSLLAEFHKTSEAEFISRYCRWVMYYGGIEVLALFEEKNHDCVLWNNGCSAYEARPVQCRTWPFWSWIVADKESWDDCAKNCPGMNQGKSWPKEFIDQEKTKYDENIPLSKEEWENSNNESK